LKILVFSSSLKSWTGSHGNYHPVWCPARTALDAESTFVKVGPCASLLELKACGVLCSKDQWALFLPFCGVCSSFWVCFGLILDYLHILSE